MSPIDSGRVTRTYTQHIEARPEAVFPLICPVREADWLDGWIDQVETVWRVTRHDPIQRVQITHTFTPLGPAGQAFVEENHSDDVFRKDMNHWLRSGEIPRAPAR